MTRGVYVPDHPPALMTAMTIMRRLKEVSASQMARKLGIPVTKLYRWERGETPISLEDAERYLLALDCRLAIVPPDPERYAPLNLIELNAQPILTSTLKPHLNGATHR